jgi:ribosomal protein L7/L12
MTEASRLPPDVARALADGDRPEAIRRLRAATGLDAREAHRIVDAAASSPDHGPGARGTAQRDPGPRVSHEVRRAAEEGRTLEAIALLRRESGLSLRESRAVVDRLAGASSAWTRRRPGAEHDTGLGRFFAILVFLLALLGAWLWYTGALPDLPGLPESPADASSLTP